MVFARKSQGISISGKKLPTTEIFEDQIKNWRLDILDRGKFGKVIAKYHDFATGEEKQVFAGNDDPIYEIRFTFTDESRAINAAKTKLAEFERGITKLELSLAGNPNLSAEKPITILDIRYLKDKNWIINSVNHELSDQGYKSTINAIEKNEMLKKDEKEKQISLSEIELEALLTKASKQGAKAALKEIGLDDDLAYMDIANLRELLKSLRMAKKHAFKVFIRWMIFGFMTLITAGFIALIGDHIKFK